jgi:hypothetical protein
MLDHLLYTFWLWMSTRWYSYRLTGMNPETGETEVVTFATEDFNIEGIIGKLKEDGTEVQE